MPTDWVVDYLCMQITYLCLTKSSIIIGKKMVAAKCTNLQVPAYLPQFSL